MTLTINENEQDTLSNMCNDKLTIIHLQPNPIRILLYLLCINLQLSFVFRACCLRVICQSQKYLILENRYDWKGYLKNEKKECVLFSLCRERKNVIVVNGKQVNVFV